MVSSENLIPVFGVSSSPYKKKSAPQYSHQEASTIEEEDDEVVFLGEKPVPQPTQPVADIAGNARKALMVDAALESHSGLADKTSKTGNKFSSMHVREFLKDGNADLDSLQGPSSKRTNTNAVGKRPSQSSSATPFSETPSNNPSLVQPVIIDLVKDDIKLKQPKTATPIQLKAIHNAQKIKALCSVPEEPNDIPQSTDADTDMHDANNTSASSQYDHQESHIEGPLSQAAQPSTLRNGSDDTDSLPFGDMSLSVGSHPQGVRPVSTLGTLPSTRGNAPFVFQSTPRPDAATPFRQDTSTTSPGLAALPGILAKIEEAEKDMPWRKNAEALKRSAGIPAKRNEKKTKPTLQDAKQAAKAFAANPFDDKNPFATKMFVPNPFKRVVEKDTTSGTKDSVPSGNSDGSRKRCAEDADASDGGSANASSKPRKSRKKKSKHASDDAVNQLDRQDDDRWPTDPDKALLGNKSETKKQALNTTLRMIPLQHHVRGSLHATVVRYIDAVLGTSTSTLLPQMHTSHWKVICRDILMRTILQDKTWLRPADVKEGLLLPYISHLKALQAQKVTQGGLPYSDFGKNQSLNDDLAPTIANAKDERVSNVISSNDIPAAIYGMISAIQKLTRLLDADTAKYTSTTAADNQYGLDNMSPSSIKTMFDQVSGSFSKKDNHNANGNQEDGRKSSDNGIETAQSTGSETAEDVDKQVLEAPSAGNNVMNGHGTSIKTKPKLFPMSVLLGQFDAPPSPDSAKYNNEKQDLVELIQEFQGKKFDFSNDGQLLFDSRMFVLRYQSVLARAEEAWAFKD